MKKEKEGKKSHRMSVRTLGYRPDRTGIRLNPVPRRAKAKPADR